MIVTELVPIDKNRIKVNMDGSFAFWVYKRDFRKYIVLENFQPGQEVSRELLQTVYQEILFPRAKETALCFLDRRDYSELEIRRKLKEKKFPEELIDKVITYLYEYHYLDEERLVRSYLAKNTKDKSRRMILLKLGTRGISEETIQKVMESENYEGDTAAFYALRKKLKEKTSEQISWEEKQKINAYLYRKGFTGDEIYHAWAFYKESETAL